MKKLWGLNLLKLITVFVLVIRLEAVTVNPAPCPTNKIAPHKRTTRWDHSRPRTFGTFYNLLAPTGFPIEDSLVETPQEDAPDDCGDIEDYDENDLSSVTSQSQRRQGHRDNRFFHDGPYSFLYPFQQPNKPTNRPPVTFRPIKPNYPPTRPPYASGGVFGNNLYKPPLAQNPSVHVKPVHDGIHESQMTYRPGIVGAPSGTVVGASQVIPTRHTPQETTSQKKPIYSNNSRFPPHTTQASSNASRRPRTRKINEGDSIIGSFISLLFK